MDTRARMAAMVAEECPGVRTDSRSYAGAILTDAAGEIDRLRGVAEGYVEREADRRVAMYTPSGHDCVVCRTVALMVADGNYVCADCAWIYCGRPLGRAGRVVSFAVVEWMNRQPRPVIKP